MKRSPLLFFFSILVTAVVGATLGSWFTVQFLRKENQVAYNSIAERQKSLLVKYQPDTSYHVPEGLDFLEASDQVTSSVVHIRTAFGSGNFSINPLHNDDYGRSSGSGVILTDDGYIVTNNHVIEDATSIEVIMTNNKSYYANVVGTDPSTDLALLKIHANSLPFVRYGNSDLLRPGEWVLAIGNPFDLNSTVTAGIISAKARNIGILRDRNNLQVESFIQTDAAVNPGNSGGALINLKGELIGINTAIATSSGSYQGYSFAIPVSLVSKVVDDLLEFGSVQRGLLGIQIQDLDGQIAEKMELSTSQGALVIKVNNGSAAQTSGIESGDVIVAIEDLPVRSVSELQELVARHRPGKKIRVSYLRDGQIIKTMARLRSYDGKDEVYKPKIKYEIEGALFENVPYKLLNHMGIEGGVKIKKLSTGKWERAGIPKDFIIVFIDKVLLEDVEDLNRILAFKRGGVLVEGFTKEGEQKTFALQW